jgi:signal peptidase I
MSTKVKKEIYSWGIVIIVVLVLRAVFVEAYVIPTGSMEETLLIGDALLVNRFIYGIKFPYTQIPLISGRNPRRGEIIVFKYLFENKDFVKRCIAIEGDTVQVVNKEVYINSKRISESYIYHRDRRNFEGIKLDKKLYQKLWENAELINYVQDPRYIRDNFGPIVVPRDCIFAMGDNRDNSLDSRFWGPLHKKFLKGKPLFIYFSFDMGGEATNLFDILKIWRWRAIRLSRIGRVI